MSTPKRKLLLIDGDEWPTEPGSITVDHGGLEGEDVTADSGFVGAAYEAKPGRVTAKVIMRGDTPKSLWDRNVPRDIEVAYPEAGPSSMFNNMYQLRTLKIDGTTAEIEFVGPEGEYEE